jgi:hypothetical protein
MGDPHEVKPSIDPHLAAELINNSVSFTNVGQNVLTTTADRIRLCLRDYEKALKAKSDWTTPLGSLIAFVASLVAAEFKPFLGLSADIWKSLFLVGALASGAFFIRGLYRAYRVRGCSDVEWVIKQIKEYRS